MKGVLPLPQTDLAYGLSDGYAKSGVAVEDCDADLDFRNLPFEVPRHQRLAEQFHTMHPLTGRVFPKEMSREVSFLRDFGGGIRSSVATECGPDIVAH